MTGFGGCCGQPPCWDGILPVNKLALAGEQTGEAQKKESNRIPSAARRSKLGVIISLFPEHPIAHSPWSSDNKNIILGLFFIRFLLLFTKLRQARFQTEILFKSIVKLIQNVKLFQNIKTKVKKAKTFSFSSRNIFIKS